VNPARAGGADGYVDMGGWVGGQAEYVMVPFADFNLLKFPDKNQALAAEAVVGVAIFSNFSAEQRAKGLTDFNDLIIQNPEVVSRQLDELFQGI
jgi:threonine dehydrogenase-like Zn-dependent dehydrogenase